MAWLVIATVLLAGWRTRHDAGLFFYFFAQLGYVPVTRYYAWAFSDMSIEYAWAYVVMTGLILLAILSIVAQAIHAKQNSWHAAGIVAVVAISVGHLAFTGIEQPIKYYDYIGVVEATVLFWAGLVILGLAAYQSRWTVPAVLGLLWLAQALFRWGFYIHLPAQEWLKLNWRVPPILCIIAFGLIAIVGAKDGSPAIRESIGP